MDVGCESLMCAVGDLEYFTFEIVGLICMGAEVCGAPATRPRADRPTCAAASSTVTLAFTSNPISHGRHDGRLPLTYCRRCRRRRSGWT